MDEKRIKGIFEWNLKKEEIIYILNPHIISLGFRCFHEKSVVLLNALKRKLF
jgi:hypothetical protein